MIRILTDSASDILPAEAAQLGVSLIPLNVTFEDGTVIRDGVDLTPAEFYARMETCHHLPMTSQPSPELFERFFREADEAGDVVIGIFLSHELSGTYQCAKLAADMANVDNVRFVDSGMVCLGESLLVHLAARLRDEGRTADQIVDTLENAKQHLHLVAAIDNLKYLRKGGRLPAAAAGGQGPRPARRLCGPVQEDRGDGRHPPGPRPHGGLHPQPPGDPAHPELSVREPGPQRPHGAPDRLCHRHPRRAGRLRPGLL